MCAGEEGSGQARSLGCKRPESHWDTSTSGAHYGTQIRVPSMSGLCFPDKLVLQLVDSQRAPVPLANVIFGVHLFATRKNDFDLAPFFTNPDGMVTITRALFDSEVRSTYDTGLMDYAAVETCSPRIRICMWSQTQVNQALHARESIWADLLSGEKQRWSSIEELRSLYRTAQNNHLTATLDPPWITDSWDGRQSEYQYDFPVKRNFEDSPGRL